MFSIREKQLIADSVQRTLRDTKHPELPAGEIPFQLHVKGSSPMSWADIQNNGAVSRPDINPHNESSDAGVEWLSSGLNTRVMSSAEAERVKGEQEVEGYYIQYQSGSQKEKWHDDPYFPMCDSVNEALTALKDPEAKDAQKYRGVRYRIVRRITVNQFMG